MKLTVIGYWGGYPAPDGATSSYLLEKDGYSLLMDAGSGSLSKLQKYKQLDQLDAVILSHYHQDHIADIGVLQYSRLVQSFVTGAQDVLPIYGHMEDKEGFDSLTHEYTEGVPYEPSGILEAGPFRISFQKSVHPVPCYGMRISDGESVLVYTADTSYQQEWVDFARNADLLITDCNFYAGQDGTKAGHMTSREGGQIAEAAGVRELMLSHLPQYGDNEQLVREAEEVFNGGTGLAYEGRVWEN
ncbi:MBL fold metallo-hydrolase [Virgibacillus xinjiangensis]|uniref:MBL fold metallo-hydrolase n=1 Tax=Virgibacillus xinjiangensis TaxID=393090 RepID=A0ABV7CWR2_9BACI